MADKILNKVIELIEQESLVGPDGRQHRQEAIMANDDRFRLLGALALHYLAPLFAGPVRKRQLGLYQTNNLTYIGTGANSSVLLSNEGQVIKLVRDSATKSQQARNEGADELREMIAITADCHGDEALKTEVTPSFPLPAKRNKQLTYLALTQQFVEGENALHDLSSKYLVQQFAERSLDVMGPQGLLPDLIGHDNLLTNGDEGIVLVDTVPMSADNPISQKTGRYRSNENILRDLAQATR